jgi:CRISPR-associated protein Csd1
MLLKLLYDYALSRNLLEDPAFVKRPVRWIIQLDDAGQLIGDWMVDTKSDERKKGSSFDIPKTTRPTGGGQVSDFLVDDIGALFGLNTKPQLELNQRSANNLRGKTADFWLQIQKARDATAHPAFEALLKFHDSLNNDPPPFLKLDTTGTPKWMMRKATGEEFKLGAELLTFAVNGQILVMDDSAVRPYWRQVHAEEMRQTEQSATRGLCLVTGQLNSPLAMTHTPMVTGLPFPARGTGAGIVGFESKAFCSYGFEQSLNAPVSVTASKAYLAALQELSKRKNNWLAIGPSWLCFWAVETEVASDFFALLLTRPDSKTVREFMTTPWSGVEHKPNDLEPFIAITFSAAGPRIIVKHWLQTTLGQAVRNFQEWFKDLTIAPYGVTTLEEDGRSPLSVDRLACTTLRRKQDGRFDREKLAPDLIASLYQAALEKLPPPVRLLKPILDRLAASLAKNEHKALYDHSRFALLKLIINRNRKDSEMEIRSELVADTDDAAYNCGRLLAVFENLQREAQGKDFDGAGVVERYYGSASSAPNSAFGILWRLHQHHLKKVSRQGDKGKAAAEAIKHRIAEIACHFAEPQPNQPPSFPRTFNLQAQGRFALGFYQQKAASDAEKRAHSAKKQQSAAKSTESDSIMPTEKENNS